MNSLIQLKGQLTPRKNPSRGGGLSLPAYAEVKIDKLDKIKHNLEELYDYWKDKKLIDGTLINVEYNRIVPKSKRIKTILFKNSNENTVDCIKGAKYGGNDENPYHIITYYVPLDNLLWNVEKIQKCSTILKEHFENKFNNADEKKISTLDFAKYNISKTTFMEVITDCSIITKLSYPIYEKKITESQAITLFDVNKKVADLLESLQIKGRDFSILDDNTVIFYKDALSILVKEAPYLISMAVEDISNYELPISEVEDILEIEKIAENIRAFPSPSDEPIIGVLDTAFDNSVYFSEWVDYSERYMEDGAEITAKDKEHGTAVDSIIVDGASINPKLNDGCGRFRVRHFCIAHHGKNSTFSIMRRIKEIVENNLDIKVWNLSLGAENEIEKNFISQEGALLDMLEYKYDVIFIVAGTNKSILNQEKIGSPADSINSLVVNSIKNNGEKASYSRKGKVLSFFNKPDICYYGGDIGEEIRTCIGTGQKMNQGTSFAAPWIARKMAYLIYKLQLSREIAKALLIDSATGWNAIDDSNAEYYGFGNVPIKIEDVINSQKDEIKFFIESVASEYDTYTYGIPVPIDKDKCPYIAKATLCYFPKCTRNQGVDYTNTELDLYFGRVAQNQKGNITIKTINNNKQSDTDGRVFEGDARKYNRKWDNVKHIVEEYKTTARPKKVYENPSWGLSVKSKDRLGNGDGKGIKFGVVITLKEINGINRYDEFIRQCSFKGWLVNRIDVDNRLELYNVAEQEVEFE
ncbi:MAG: S8 family peptidase [Clostridia bacterium]|nr:S8 family peptidase [Clostridia bacterium]